MYAAKAAGGNRHVTYEPQLYDATVARMELKADLRGALERGELHVAYQPIVDLESGRDHRVGGADALEPPDARGGPADGLHPAGRGERAHPRPRSLDPRDGLPPDAGVAGGHRAPGPDDQRQPVRAPDPGPATSSPDVRRILAESGLAPPTLTLEITESVLIQDVDATVGTLQALKALGVRLAIDDFGTGYSSLSYLRQFPIDILKIDRSFISSLDGSNDSMALVRSILNLSSTLRLETVAEGIEEPDQRDVLRGLGAQQGQGYLFARPMAPDDLGDLLAGRSTTGPERRLGPPRVESRRPCRTNQLNASLNSTHEVHTCPD